MRLTQKQETFCLKYFELGNASTAARIAKYSPKTAYVMGAENLSKPKIQARIQELRLKVEDSSVAKVLERQQILSEIARGRLADFIEAGQDGAWINIDKEKMNTAALQAIDSKTEYDENGSHPTVVTKIRLHNPTQAIDLLNKMDKIYSEGEKGTNNDNRITNYVFILPDGTRVSPRALLDYTKAIDATE